MYIKKETNLKKKNLKEFSILFLIINNLDIFRKNIELISKITFSNNLMNEFKKKLLIIYYQKNFLIEKN